MTQFLIQNAASFRLDEIYRYTTKKWGSTKAESYISGMFDAFEKIDTDGTFSHPVPAQFGVDGFFFKYGRHFIYWKYLSNGVVGIVTILHERMHQIECFKEDSFTN